MDKLDFYRQTAVASGSLANYLSYIQSDPTYMAASIHHSSAIEGNTLTEGDTLAILLNGCATRESLNKYAGNEIIEVEDLFKAYRMMYASLTMPLSRALMLDLHEIQMKRLMDSAGVVRRDTVFTLRPDGSIKYFLTHDLIEGALQRMIHDYNSAPAKGIYSACMLKLQYIQIHPFFDGNGRLSRMLLNWVLIQGGYPPVIIPVSDSRYYIDTLEAYGETGDVNPFMEYIEGLLLNVFKTII